MLESHKFPALRPEWVLRNEGDKVILYLMSVYEAKYQILDPVASVVASLLDGQHNVAELTDAIRYIMELSSADSARSLLENVVKALNKDTEEVAVLDKPAPWQVNYDPVKFVISPKDFTREHRLTKPLSLMVYFSGWCQTECRYCYADLQNMRKLEHLSLEKWLPILDDARELDIRLIQLTGGDPLGRPESIDFLIDLVKLGFLFMVSTKCFVSLSDAHRLIDAGFNEPVNGVKRDFQVSIDSADSAIADFLVGRKGYLFRATKTLSNLLEVGISTRVKAVLTSFNYADVRNLIQNFAAIGVKRFQFSTYGRSHYFHDAPLFLSDDMKAKAADLLTEVARERPDLKIEGDATKYVPTTKDQQRQKEEQWVVRVGCSAGRSSLGIAPSGWVVLCEQMPLTAPYFFGDLAKQSIQDVWHSSKLLNFICPPRESFSGTACYDCVDFDYCIHDLGHCYRESLFAYDRLHHPPPRCPHAPLGGRRLI